MSPLAASPMEGSSTRRGFHALRGPRGFERAVTQVAELRIADLAAFTPPSSGGAAPGTGANAI